MQIANCKLQIQSRSQTPFGTAPPGNSVSRDLGDRSTRHETEFQGVRAQTEFGHESKLEDETRCTGLGGCFELIKL
jgi:hypothetical protein